jgi:2-oxoglutarate ferredoxin oxidoreductase subunit alpha
MAADQVRQGAELAEANIAALNAGHAYGETAEIGGQIHQQHLAPAPAAPGLYRTVTGAEAISIGLVAGAKLPGCRCSSAAIRSRRLPRSCIICRG